MTENTPITASSPRQVRPAELAAYLAARMCHDFISPASAIVSGLDLLDDPSAQDMREDAMNLIGASAHKLADLLAFSRVAFGASASAETFDARELEKLAKGVFAHVRAELDWAVETPAINKPAARLLLNLAQMAGAALPTGGRAHVQVTLRDEVISITIDCAGPRARVRPEVLDGLAGQAMGEGLHGHWVQAYYAHLVAMDAGGRVQAQVNEEQVRFTAVVPA